MTHGYHMTWLTLLPTGGIRCCGLTACALRVIDANYVRHLWRHPGNSRAAANLRRLAGFVLQHDQFGWFSGKDRLLAQTDEADLMVAKSASYPNPVMLPWCTDRRREATASRVVR
jgi:hypothetical protein